jgi:hypothetical protein
VIVVDRLDALVNQVPVFGHLRHGGFFRRTAIDRGGLDDSGCGDADGDAAVLLKTPVDHIVIVANHGGGPKHQLAAGPAGNAALTVPPRWVAGSALIETSKLRLGRWGAGLGVEGAREVLRGGRAIHPRGERFGCEGHS